MKRILTFLLFISGVAAKAQPTINDVWINEFHYDGLTTLGQSDQSEFVEIVVKTNLYNNAAELSKLKLVLYTAGALEPLNAGRGLPYNVSSPWYNLAETEYPLSSFQACTTTSTLYTILSKPMSVLQDIPAGFALVYNNTTIVQLLSYEKAFNIAPTSAGGGPAAGMTTTLIAKPGGAPAEENATTPNNHSVSLVGTGTNYNQFTWSDAVIQTATPCATNSGQTLASTAPLPVKWLDFKASGSEDKIYTQWLVAEDNTTARYEVEVKGVAYNSFTKLATVARQTGTDSRYNQVLTNLQSGTYLVRIKAVEVNGSSYYSAERMVRLGRGISSLAVYPNPVQNQAFIQFAAGENSGYSLHLIDATGRVVKQQNLGSLKANQLNNLTLDLQGVSHGTYQLKIKGASEQLHARVIVVK